MRLRRLTRLAVPAVMLAAVMAATPAVALPGAEAARLFAAGNEHYAAGRYDEAAAQYRSLLEQGFRSEAVHYNLGNALFKMERLGPAILEYERAARLAPRDEDIQANLRYARSLTADRMSEGGAHTTSFFLERLLELTSPDQDAAFFLAVYLTGGALGALWIVARTIRWRRLVAACLIALAVPLAVSGASLGVKVYRMATLRQAVVLRERVDVLSGPGDDNTTLFTVHEGLRLDVRDRQGAWWRVRLDNGLSGWVPAETLGTI
jgi:tetratricopeptide (TPR) repeat protein